MKFENLEGPYAEHLRSIPDEVYYKHRFDDMWTSQVLDQMEAKGVTKKDLADKLGTSQGYITRVIRGDIDISMSMFARVLVALDLKVQSIAITRR